MRQAGLIVAPLTPLTTDLKVDEPALRRQIDRIIKSAAALLAGLAGDNADGMSYRSNNPADHSADPRTDGP
jgi:dihydrodipicolinate synthase/N-acetylneuraminate lyase